MEKIWQILGEVCDPEVPVLSVLDLGIIRHVEQVNDKIIITITPTYSGCPAMNTIEKDIKAALLQAGFDNIEIKTILSPAWTTDWLSENGKRKLEAYGIAPPVEPTANVGVLFGKDPGLARGSDDRLVFFEIGKTQQRGTALPLAEILAGATQGQVGTRDFEAVDIFVDRL